MIVKAVMVPHPPLAVSEVGRGDEKKIQKTLDAYHQAAREIAETKPETVIIISPHALMYRDYFNISRGKEAYGDLGRFRAGMVAFEKEYDEEFTHALTELLYAEGFPGGTEYDNDPQLDHGTMVPLYFLSQYLPEVRIVRIGLSGLPLAMHYRLGMYIAETAEKLNRRIAVIGSGDLAHCQKEDGPYGYKPEGPEYDEKIMKTMGSGDFGELFAYPESFLNAAMECGHRAFVIMAGILDGLSVTPHVLSHEATFGVGYGIITYDISGSDDNRHFLASYSNKEKNRLQDKMQSSDAWVRLARASLESYILHGRVLKVPEGLPEELYKEKAGCFVSIHEHGELRGCIGTIAATKPSLAKEIIDNAISAGCRDPRFSPIGEDELEWLEINVDVLGKPQPVTDISELDVKKYGVICSSRGRRGLLLPDLEGVDTVEQQLDIACSKGGFDRYADDLEIERFEVIRHV